MAAISHNSFVNGIVRNESITVPNSFAWFDTEQDISYTIQLFTHKTSLRVLGDHNSYYNFNRSIIKDILRYFDTPCAQALPVYLARSAK
ncbi:MAG: hypothetical protein Q4F84_02650 [Fibrobacter sp.]|nr:hypothetical protein [Fibrobacter sp.]